MTGLWVLVGALVVSVAVGLVLKARDGRFRAVPAAAPALAALGVEWGERATLLQFSTSFCAPCRATRQVLAEAARVVPGVAHVEVDAESHLELVRQLGIRRTPTVLILDAHAVEVRRAAGAPPSRAAVLAALDHAIEHDSSGDR